jgi:glyceraldehyde-3-phosphate dehydrogenase/erythrose-4-phosphate dehydrogenase
MAKDKIVHVVGTGTIGEPLIGLLAEFKEAFGIDEVTFHKRTPLLTDRSKVKNLIRRGARFVTDSKAFDTFRELGLEPELETHEALDRAAVVIDCTPSGVGAQNKIEYYERFKHNTLGFLAQGSEFGFGKPYARGINDAALNRETDQYLQIVSCNTHNVSVLVDALALADGGPSNLVEGRFVCIRRANDISQDGSFCPAPEVGSHKDRRFGTHHARDAWYLFQTLGKDYDLNLYSSALKINTQYMHTIWFSLIVKNKCTVDDALARLQANDRIALTHKKSANAVFSFGRDHGHFGRILNQTVVVKQTVAVRETDRGTEVLGFCFTPQDGNPLLSTVAAVCWYLDPKTYQERIQALKPYFYDEV